LGNREEKQELYLWRKQR